MAAFEKLNQTQPKNDQTIEQHYFNFRSQTKNAIVNTRNFISFLPQKLVIQPPQNQVDLSSF